MAMQEAKPSPPGLSAHPEERELQAFLRGELPRDEVRAIVRHLLTACPACRRVTGRLWALAGDDEPMGPEGESLS